MDTLLNPRALRVIENSSPPFDRTPTEREDSWKHVSVALAPVVSRLRRLRALDAEVQP